MDNWTDSTWEVPPSEQDKATKLQLRDFFKQARKYRADILTARKALSYAHHLFRDEADIWPEQCDRAISSILTMREHVKLFCQLLDEVTCLPTDTSLQCYELMVVVYYVDEEIRKLTSLLSSFRPICRSSSKQVISQRQKIFSRLEIFMESSDDILRRITYLLDAAHFPKLEPSYLSTRPQIEGIYVS